MAHTNAQFIVLKKYTYFNKFESSDELVTIDEQNWITYLITKTGNVSK